MDIREHPTDFSEDSVVTEENAAFLQAGDRVEFEVTIENRVAETCTTQTQPTDNLEMRAYYITNTSATHDDPTLPEEGDGFDDASQYTEQRVSLKVDCQSLDPGQTCEQTVSLPTFSGSDGVESSPLGEHRVRFEVAQTDDALLTGAERVLVVGQLPDLTPSAIPGVADKAVQWEEPENGPNQHTTYAGESGATTFNVTLDNVGAYPNWNPNGGNQFAERSSFDDPDDGNLAPDEDSGVLTSRESSAEDIAWACHWDSPWKDYGQPNTCSYRRGSVMDLPLHWRLTEDGTDVLLEDGVDRSYDFDDDSQDTRDKDDAVPHDPSSGEEYDEAAVDTSPEIRHIVFDGFDRKERAGLFQLDVRVDHDPTDQRETWTPDADEDNDDHERDVRVRSVDMELSSLDTLSVENRETLCTTPDDQCNLGRDITIEALFRNDRDSNIPLSQNARDRYWNATVTKQLGDAGDEVRALDTGGDEIVHRRPNVPEEGSEHAVFGDPTVTVQSPDKGGKMILRIRLDHPAAYGEDAGVTDPNGRVTELTEQPDCPAGWDDPSQWDDHPPINDASNTYCVALYYNDTTAPEISDERIPDPGYRSDGLPVLDEGVNGTFRATVTDNALEDVEAHFIDPEGNKTLVRPMEKNESAGENAWDVNQSFEGTLGKWVMELHAFDSQHETVADGFEFRVEELNKTINTAVGQDTVNGVTGPLGEDAPAYRGTADDPQNTFNITANFSETGRAPDDPTGKNLTLHDPDGEARATVPMDDLRTCTWESQIPEQSDETHYGSDCNEGAADDGFEITDRRTWWYVDNTQPGYEDVENISLPWVGEFNLTVETNDTFDRVNTSNWTVEISDRTNDNGLAEPNVTEVDVGPTDLSPGDALSASAYAKDALRVERVYLDVVKPGGDEAEAALSLTTPDQTTHDTANGTWSGSFTAGVDGDVFDRAGTYEVELVAEDFAGNENRTTVGPVSVEAGDPPAITAFFTEPPEEVEAGTNLTWVAQIDTTTAIKDPTLTISKPDGSTEEKTLTFDEDRERWTVNATPEGVLDSDRETWTYSLEVSDYADQTDTSEGEIDIVANTAPRATAWKPNIPGDPLPFGGPEPNIRVRLVDGNGVDADTINMTVNGDTVYAEGSGEAERTTIPDCEGCYKLSYTPTEAFEDGETVRVEIRATDDSSERLTSEWQVHQFDVDATKPTASVHMAPSFDREGPPVIGRTTNINVSTRDDASGPGELRVEVASLAGATRATVEERVFEEGEASFRLPDFEDAFRGHGEYQIVTYPTDAAGNEGDQTQTRVLYDEAPPKIFLEPQLNQPASVIAANVTDLSSIEEVVVVFTADDGPERQIELEREGDLWTGQIVDPDTGDPYPENTTIEYTVKASDVWANTGTKGPNSFLAGNTPPDVTFEAPEQGALLQGTAEIRWTATDDETPADALNMSLWYKQPGGQPREIPGAMGLDNVGRYQLDTTKIPNGDLELQVIAFDGATFSQATVNVTVRNLGDAFTSPELTGAETQDGRATVQPSQETTFRVQIDENTRSAWANVTTVDGETVASYRLEDQGGGTWQTTLTAPEEEGNYEITLEALTPDGRIQAQSAYAFQVNEDGKSFVPEWTILSVLFAGAVAVGAFGLARRWD